MTRFNHPDASSRDVTSAHEQEIEAAGADKWGSGHAARDAVARRILEIVGECGGECDTEAAHYIAENVSSLIRTHGSPDVAAIRREAVEEAARRATDMAGAARVNGRIQAATALETLASSLRALAGDAPAERV